VLRIALLTALLLSVVAATTAPAAAPPTRTCAQEIMFSGPPYFGQEGSVVVGPLSFSGLAHGGGARQADGRWFVKSVLLVRPRAVVTLSVLPDRRVRPVLVYSATGRESTAIRFESCPAARAAFNGGFVVRRLDCVRIVVAVEGGRTYRRTLDFRGFLGSGPCPARA
jgi:hypothetical protein